MITILDESPFILLHKVIGGLRIPSTHLTITAIVTILFENVNLLFYQYKKTRYLTILPFLFNFLIKWLCHHQNHDDDCSGVSIAIERNRLFFDGKIGFWELISLVVF